MPPPSPVALPPLRVWTFIPLTGQIISRQVVVEGESSESAVTVSTASTASAGSPRQPKAVTPVKKVKNPVGVGSPAGTQPPTVPNPVGEVVAGGAKASLEEGEEAEDAEEDDEGVADEDDLEVELKKLESMSGKKNKGKGGSELKPKRAKKAA